MTWLRETKSWFLSTFYFPDDEIESMVNDIIVKCNQLAIDVSRRNIQSNQETMMIESNDDIILNDNTSNINQDPAIDDKGKFCHCGDDCNASCICSIRGNACVIDCDCNCNKKVTPVKVKDSSNDNIIDDDNNIQTPASSKASPAMTKRGTECKDCIHMINKYNKLCNRHQKNEEK